MLTMMVTLLAKETKEEQEPLYILAIDLMTRLDLAFMATI